jgi:ABC-type phosphate transport system substrate-binding protein
LQKPGNKKLVAYHILVILFCFAANLPIVTATEVVVNKSVPAADYSKVDIRAIFTMQKRFWLNNKQIKVYTLSDSSPLHKDFVKNILNMFPHQIRLVWDRMTFSGTGIAPIELDSEQEMMDKIANTPDSIGYLSQKPNNENIRSFEFH